nr:FAD-dependent oxidoreductase [Aquabacterium sp.]
PACPTVVCPPAMGTQGQWVVEPVEEGLVSKFVSETGALLGFALQGKATAQRQALAAQVPATL